MEIEKGIKIPLLIRKKGILLLLTVMMMFVCSSSVYIPFVRHLTSFVIGMYIAVFWIFKDMVNA